MRYNKSALKRQRQSEIRHARNVYYKSSIKTLLKRINSEIEAKDTEKAKTTLIKVSSLLNRAFSKGIIHKNYVSRKISQLASKISGLEKQVDN